MNSPITTHPIRFHFFSLYLKPLKESSSLSNTDIIIKIISYIQRELQNKKGHLIDRNQNRPEEPRRRLFISHAAIVPKEKRIKCTIALIRDGRLPMFMPTDSFMLIPLEDTKGSMVEATHFFIDYSKTPAIMCVEYNNFGPRGSDIEYYFRNVGNKTLALTKQTDVNLFMDSSIDKTLQELKNVLDLDIKIQPQKLVHLDKNLKDRYFFAMENFGKLVNPQFLRLKAYYHSPGNKVTSDQLNAPANAMIVNLLTSFKNRPLNIEAFSGFVVNYKDKDGNDGVFNLLKGKREILKEIDFSKTRKASEWYEIIKIDFDEFVKTIPG